MCTHSLIVCKLYFSTSGKEWDYYFILTKMVSVVEGCVSSQCLLNADSDKTVFTLSPDKQCILLTKQALKNSQ